MTVSNPANYHDPAPNPELFGWGEPKLTLRQKLAVERTVTANLIDNKSDKTNFNAKTVRGATAIPEKIEARIRSHFKFDKGWDLMVAERLVYGLDPDETLMISQNIGNCVGDSHACCIAARIAHEILAEGDAEDPLGTTQWGATSCIPFIPYTYGVGRWVGGMLGPGDGSYCGAQIEGTMEHGFLPCFVSGLEKYAGSGVSALPQGTSSAGRLFGKSKAEIQKWTDKAADFDLLEAPVVKDADTAIELIVEKKVPLQICSGWGFRYKGFDSKYGVDLYSPGGSWSHSMQMMAAFEIKGQWFLVIRNQWGHDAAKGSPSIGIAGGCMVITVETFAKWVRDSETIGIGQIQGLPSNPGF